LIKLKSAFRVLTRSLYPTCINVWKLEKAPCSERIFQNGDRLALVCSFFSCNSHGVGPIVPSSKDHVSRRESNKTPKVTIADFKDQGLTCPTGRLSPTPRGSVMQGQKRPFRGFESSAVSPLSGRPNLVSTASILRFSEVSGVNLYPTRMPIDGF
jgi:hypothetical protein